MRKFAKMLIKATLFAPILLLWGCSTLNSQSYKPPIPEEVRRQVRSVAVIPAAYNPESIFYPSAARGSGFFSAGGAGPLEFPLFLIFFTAGVVVEAADQAVPADEAQKIEAAVNSAILTLNVQEGLANRMVSAGPAITGFQFNLKSGQGPTTQDATPQYNSANVPNTDVVIEVGVRNLGFLGGRGKDPETSFFMEVAVRTVRIVDGVEIYSGQTSHISKPRKFTEWSNNGAIALQQELEKAYAGISEAILEKLFLEYDLYMKPALSPDSYCMLKPYNPPQNGGLDLSLKLLDAKVDSLRPTFQWEAFPRKTDIQYDSTGLLTKIDEITYDLKIWSGHGGYPEELIYDKRGIPALERDIEIPLTGVSDDPKELMRMERIAEHSIEIQLKPSTEYFWAVRPRFRLEGLTRTTKWSHTRKYYFPGGKDPCLMDFIPMMYYHRFKTPQ